MNNQIPEESIFLLYNTPEGDVNLKVLLRDETIWLLKKMNAELF